MASQGKRAGEGLSASGVLTRLAIAFVLVYATYNPEGWSYYHWLVHSHAGSAGPPSWSDNPALKFVAGIGLAIGWVIFLNAARRSLGAVGIVLVIALCAGLVWVLVSWEVISASSVRGLTHITLAVLAIVLAVGLSWSHVSRRVTGQVDADIVD
jgi:hypothetical protein